MNESGTDMLRTIYEFLLMHQRSVAELMNVTKALVTAVESSPKLYAAFETQYAALRDGPAQRENAKLIAELEKAIRKLTVQ